jgi:hypothetical protein
MTALIDDMHAETAFRHVEPRDPRQSPPPLLIDVPALSPMGSNDVAFGAALGYAASPPQVIREINEGGRVIGQRTGAGGPARRR